MSEELKTIETVDLTPFKYMVMTIGELPTSFVESMTYYEALAWLDNYLENTLIPTINNNAEAVEELQGLYIQLHDYVQNYFDNLDVQEEINNKLDAMAEAGTLQEIINEYLQSNVAWTFDTVADMKLATNLIDGSYARTLGFRSINDGGGALYKITDSGTANEMDVIAIGSTLYANLVLPTEVTPEIYGAYCNGTNNDAPYIQAAINSDHPVILSKNYYTTSSVYIGNQDPSISGGYKKDLVINGSTSTITYNGGNSAIVIAGVEGGKFEFGTINATSGTCIEMWSTNGNVRVDYIDLSFMKLSPSEKGIYMHADTTSSGNGFINEITINGGTIFSGDYGIYVVCNRETSSNTLGMSGHHYNNVCFEGCDSNFYFNANSSCIREFEFNGIRYEENRTAPLMTFVGNIFRNFVFNGMFQIFEDRIDFSGATSLRNCVFNSPIANGNDYASTIIASGMIINNNIKNYLNNSYNTRTLTKESNAYGTIELDIYMNQVVINFASIGSDLTDGTLVIADNMPIKPIKRAMCAVCSNANTTAYVTIDTDGKIMLHRRTGDGDVRYWGQMTILSYSPKRQN